MGSRGKGEWHTPINAMKNKEEVWMKLEKTGWVSVKKSDFWFSFV